MNGFSIGYLLTFLITVILGVSILVRNPGSQINKVFFVLSVAVALSAFSQFEFVKAESPERAVFWYRTGVLWPLVLSLLLHFSMNYPRPSYAAISLRRGLAIYLPAVALVVALVASPEGSLISPIKVGNYWAADAAATPSVVSYGVIVASILYTGVIAAYCIAHLKAARSIPDKRQRAIVLAGVCIGLGASILSYGVFRGLNIHTPDIATFGFGIGCVVIGYATWKYKLFALNVATAAEEIVKAMPSALLLLGPDRDISRVNEAASRLLNMPAESLIGRKFFDLALRERIADIQSTGFFGGERLPVESEFVDGNGNTIPVSLIFSPVYDKYGVQAGTVCVARDQRRTLAAEAEKAELQERLLQAEKMEAIGRLAGGVAHDFNNILGGILGYADLMKSEIGDSREDLSEYVGNIIDGSKRAAGLVENLLAFARKGQIKLEVVDLHQVIQRVTGLLEHTFDKRISVQLDLCTASPLVHADMAQLHNAVLNLAVNARDAMEEGGVLTISTGVEAVSGDSGQLDLDAGTYVKVSVADTGTGMSKQVQERIFEPFFTTKDVGKGTGLGLSSVYGTAKSLGGTVEVESDEGAGSILTLYLPLAESVQPQEHATDPSVGAGTETVLIIDDEESVRDVTAKALQRIGFSTVSRADGGAGVKYIRERTSRVDLVILDLNLPGESGFEIFDTISILSPDLPVLIVTGMAQDGTKTAELKSRAAGFLTKPYDISQLAHEVHQILQSQ